MQQISQHKPIYNRLRLLLPSPGNVIFTVFMIGITLWAQSVGAITLGATTATLPTTAIPYQGYLTDGDDKPLDGLYAMTFKLYSQPSGGSALWAEQHNSNNRIQIEDGLFNVQLGELNAILPDVIGSSDQFYLGIAIDAGSEMTPRVHLGGLNTVKETSGTYTTDIVLTAGNSPTVTPTSLTLSYHRFGSLVIVSVPRFELALTGKPDVIEFELPVPPKTWDGGGGGVLTFNGGGPDKAAGVIVRERISYRKSAGGYQTGSFRGGFWYIAQ